MKKNSFVFCALLIAMMSAQSAMAQEALDLSKVKVGETLAGAAAFFYGANTITQDIRQPNENFLANVEANLKPAQVVLDEAGKPTAKSAAEVLVHDAKVTAIHGTRNAFKVATTKGGKIARGVLIVGGLAAVYDGMKKEGKGLDYVSESIGLSSASRPSSGSSAQ